MSTFPHFATDAVHAGQEPEKWTHWNVVPPICLSTTFKQDAPAVVKKYDYSRAGNATRDVLQECLAAVEGAKHCCVYATGLAATMAVCNLLSAGDHILCSDDLYGGSQRYMRRIASKNGITMTIADLTDSSRLEQEIKPETKLLWMESPTNPLMKIIDIREICDNARRLKPEVLIVVDNTFMSPYFQRPLDLGADISHYSVTKYLNGHVDVMMGCVIFNNPKLLEHFEFVQRAVGANPSPFDCYMANRGLKTLHLRMKAHYESSFKIAQYLERHPCVESVLYPGLPSHPQHELHKKQSKGMSGMISFFIHGSFDDAATFLANLKIFMIAVSLGGFESLAEHPAKMSHDSIPPAQRAMMGIGDNLLRLSVGLEDVEDLIADLDQAFEKVRHR